ncbi:MAG: hypothetical protein JW866_01650, partial [Ignavibacteriales bacterium]|nr:hypothetical protein [Ignavibacteriales bacterium]
STILSFIWVLLNRGGKYLIESWELKLKRYERPYILFRKIEPVKRSGPWGAVRLSTNKLLIALADFIFVFNLLILLFDFYLNYLINIFPALPNFFADKNEIFVIAIILLSSFIFMLIILLNAKITTYVCDTLDGYTFLIEKKGRWFKYVKYKNDEDRIIRIERFQSINDFKITDKDLPVVREIISKFPKVSKL